jgi:hypothetical protein
MCGRLGNIHLNNKFFILGHDHHCAWSGKCIGRINLYPFYVFVFSTFLFILMTFLSTMIYLVTYADRMNGRKI